MRIVIPGGAGQVGTVLARAFRASGDEVIILSRTAGEGRVAWDGRTPGDWCRTLDGADAVINLAGRSVNCRYHAANRAEILESRVASTRVLGEAIARCANPPRIWLQASTATIYAHRYDAANDEATGVLGNGPNEPDTWHFSYGVASSWERVLAEADTPRTRKVAMRTAIVMSPDRGGPFDIVLTLVRLGLGGRAGNGRQWVSWIHDADLVRAIRWLIDHDEVEGAVNLASPNPITNETFMRSIRAASGMPIGLPAMEWMLEAGAFFMRSESELILKSRRVVPGRLLAAGFTFEHPEWPEAARDLVTRRRRSTL
jgi:uncharacterized protein (TIGR01777 family)